MGNLWTCTIYNQIILMRWGYQSDKYPLISKLNGGFNGNIIELTLTQTMGPLGILYGRSSNMVDRLGKTTNHQDSLLHSFHYTYYIIRICIYIYMYIYYP